MFDSAAAPFESALPLHRGQTRSARITHDPRAEMALRLPSWLQPFLTWLTAVPAPEEGERHNSHYRIITNTALRIIVGVCVSVFAIQQTNIFLEIVLIIFGAVITTSGLGLVQVVIFHYCAHGIFFRSCGMNTAVGRAISAIFLFEYFDKYRENHLQHHRAQKLITNDDEFLLFLTDVCRLSPGDNKHRLWRRLIVLLLSPAFHARFFIRRIRSSLYIQNQIYMVFYACLWACFLSAVFYFDVLNEMLAAWALPLIVPLQIATVLRILCEHRIPDRTVLARRDKNFICHVTTGVFPGRPLPHQKMNSLLGATKWVLWWLDLLTVQLFVRFFVLVGDAPCHDFHHRRYGSNRWTSAIYARQKDKESGCPGYPINYIDVWGLFTAIDFTLETLARSDKLIGPKVLHH